jgi:hypothetical protein
MSRLLAILLLAFGSAAQAATPAVSLALHFEKAGDIPATVPARAHAPEYGLPGLPGGIRIDWGRSPEAEQV